MSILVFSDVHLGIKTHSVQEKDGLATAEVEARIALQSVYERAKLDDVEMILCCGDIFHTTHPTTRNIEFFIGWLNDMDNLGKPFYLITGNHDAGVYSNSLIFLNQLNLKNTGLFDRLTPNDESIWCLSNFYNWDIYFVPFVTSITSKDKEGPVYDTIKKIMELIHISNKPSILVSHVYDSDVTIGSEKTMIARYTETINFDEFQNGNSNITLLLGHAHKHQIYTKKNGMNVIYPGSLFYHDMWDVNQEKGYVLLDIEGNCIFEPIKTIREFVYYRIPESGDVLSYFEQNPVSPNKYVFLLIEQDSKVDELKLRSILKSQHSDLGNVIYKSSSSDDSFEFLSEDNKQVDPYIMFDNYIDVYLKDKDEITIINKIKGAGHSYIESNMS